jgi:hypothetical protein
VVQAPDNRRLDLHVGLEVSDLGTHAAQFLEDALLVRED